MFVVCQTICYLDVWLRSDELPLASATICKSSLYTQVVGINSSDDMFFNLLSGLDLGNSNLLEYD